MSGQEERFGGLVEAQVMIKQKRNVTGFIFHCSPSEMPRWFRLSPSQFWVMLSNWSPIIWSPRPRQETPTPRLTGTTPLVWPSPRASGTLTRRGTPRPRSWSPRPPGVRTRMPTGNIETGQHTLSGNGGQDQPPGDGGGQVHLRPLRHRQQVPGAQRWPRALRLQVTSLMISWWGLDGALTQD